MRSNHTLTEEELFATYVNFDAVPLKCSSGMSVQDTHMIDKLLGRLTSKDSEIKEAYKFSEAVATETWGFFGKHTTHKKWFGKVNGTKKRMGNPAEVEEMA